MLIIIIKNKYGEDLKKYSRRKPPKKKTAAHTRGARIELRLRYPQTIIIPHTYIQKYTHIHTHEERA